jgi:hypothetical protein
MDTKVKRRTFKILSVSVDDEKLDKFDNAKTKFAEKYKIESSTNAVLNKLIDRMIEGFYRESPGENSED